MPIRITMQEPAPADDHIRFRVRRDEGGLVHGDWARVPGGDGPTSPDGFGAVKPVAEAWEEVKAFAAAHGIAWVYVDDPHCVFDSERLGLARAPDIDCSARG